MEASDTAAQPPQEPGQTDAVGGTEQDQSQGEQSQSQEQPADDSQLTTPQPDQPVQPETERQEVAPDAEQAAPPVQEQPSPSEYQPKHLPLENAGRDQVADEARRQDELQAQRDEHNTRVAGAGEERLPRLSQPAEGSG